MRLAARTEGCGSIAEGEFRGSVVEAINKYDISSITYIYIHTSHRDRFTNMIDRYSYVYTRICDIVHSP